MANFFQINLAEIGLFVLGLGYLFTFWRQGGNKGTTEVISIYKEQIDALEKSMVLNRERNHDLGNQIQKLSLEVGVLKGQLAEREKKLEEYVSILQGKNPEQEEYMTYMRKFTEGVAKYMENSTETLKEVSIFMRDLNIKNQEV